MQKLLEKPIDAGRLALAVALWLAIAGNLTFWATFAQAAGGVSIAHGAVLAGAFLIVILIFNAALTAFSFPHVAKPIWIVLVMVSAFASYFVSAYGIVIDKGMIQNVVETDIQEARELLDWRLLAHVGLLGVLPSWLIGRRQIRFPAGARGLLRRAVGCGGSLLLAALLLVLLFKDLAPLLREHRELRYILAPTNVVQAVHGYLRTRMAGKVTAAPLGRDAVKGVAWRGQLRRTLTVIVVGETARASNFSLNGHVRETNPLLRARDGLINFSHVSSCGTATAVSLPCVFSGLGREGFSQSRAERREGLLDVLAHAGFDVLWRDNNSGCKGVCKRVRYEEVGPCQGDECYDERLLDSLPDLVRKGGKDMVVVLHQKGSHGPAYAKRYPGRFGKFGPVCNSSRFDQCSRAAIMAAYDNTILYTDYFLDRTIGLLRDIAKGDGLDTAMMYFSDHGESLGENNMYLHGAPYFMAPAEQIHVPMMVWMSDRFEQRFHIDHACLNERRHQVLSHDNVFHSVLGMLDVNTAVLNPSLDLFHPCRTRS